MSGLYAAPILIGYAISIGFDPIRCLDVFSILLFPIAIFSIYTLVVTNRHFPSDSVAQTVIKLYIFATLIFAIFLNISSPAMAWDFFGEYNYEGIVHVALRSIGIDGSSGQTLLTYATDRHPPYIMAFMGGVSVVTEKYFAGYGYFIPWVSVYFVSSAVIALANFSNKTASDNFAMVFLAVFLTIPLVTVHAILGAYSEIWTMCGVLFVQYFVCSLMLRPSASVLRLCCLGMVSIATCVTRSTGYIFMLAVLSALILTFGSVWLGAFVRDNAIAKISAVGCCGIAGIVASALFFFCPLDETILSVPVAGKILNFSLPDLSDVVVNEVYLLFFLSSFSVVPITWLMLAVGIGLDLPRQGGRKERLIVHFNMWCVSVTGVLLVLFQFTDYGAAISGAESDTGMSRLHIVFVGMQLFSIASFLAVASPHQIFVPRSKLV